MKVLTTLNGCVLIRPHPEKTLSGIEIPESVDKERATIGTVVVGNQVRVCEGKEGIRDNMYIKPLIALERGTVVIFSALAPRKVEHEGEDCLLINGEDVLAIIEE